MFNISEKFVTCLLMFAIYCLFGNVDGEKISQSKNYQCYLPRQKDLIATHEQSSRTISEASLFGLDDVIVFRCPDISYQKLLGSSTIICGRQGWSGPIPKCQTLRVRGRYSPPVIEFETKEEDIIIAANGNIIVPEKSTITLKCLWFQVFGTAEWTRTNTDLNSISEWNFEKNVLILNLENIRPEDEGNYTCTTSYSKSHSMYINVFSPKTSPSSILISTLENKEDVQTDTKQDEVVKPNQPQRTRFDEDCIIIWHSTESPPVSSEDSQTNSPTNNNFQVNSHAEEKHTYSEELKDPYHIDYTPQETVRERLPVEHNLENSREFQETFKTTGNSQEYIQRREEIDLQENKNFETQDNLPEDTNKNGDESWEDIKVEIHQTKDISRENPVLPSNNKCKHWEQDFTITFLGDNEVKEEKNFEDGTELVHRCLNIGSYKFFGSTVRVCKSGLWTGYNPMCQKLYERSRSSAPVIDYTIEKGSAMVTPNGTLSVTAGATVIFKCLWFHMNGEPKWLHEQSDWNIYSEWSLERNSFNLIIPELRAGNEGKYTCETPHKKRHSINLQVAPKPKTSLFQLKQKN